MFADTFTLIVFVAMFAIMGGWIYVISQNAHHTRKQVQQIAEQHTLIHSDNRARSICRAVHQLHPLMHAGVDFAIKRDGPGKNPTLPTGMRWSRNPRRRSWRRYCRLYPLQTRITQSCDGQSIRVSAISSMPLIRCVMETIANKSR